MRSFVPWPVAILWVWVGAATDAPRVRAQAGPASESAPAPSLGGAPTEPPPLRFSTPDESAAAAPALGAVPPSTPSQTTALDTTAPEPARPEAAAAAQASAETGQAAVPSGDAGSAEQTELRARIAAIQRTEPLDDSVRRPLDFAKAALERSRASRVVGDAVSEQRTRQLSRAAVELAEARLRLLRERALFAAARARRNVATAELGIAQRALERDRARARELERASALP
jgi:hypothetical protein